MFGRKRVKIPKDKLSGMERIEVRYPLSLQELDVGVLPKYEIRAVGAKGNKRLVDIYISSDRLSSNKGNYIVNMYISETAPGGTFERKIGQRNNLTDADQLAYKTALNIAHQISRGKGLRLENLAMEDQDKLEEDKLAREIDKLKKAKTPVFIFFTVVGVALGISSLSATGNAISNLTNTTQGLLGILFFIAGLVGLVFGRKG